LHDRVSRLLLPLDILETEVVGFLMTHKDNLKHICPQTPPPKFFLRMLSEQMACTVLPCALLLSANLAPVAGLPSEHNFTCNRAEVFIAQYLGASTLTLVFLTSAWLHKSALIADRSETLLQHFLALPERAVQRSSWIFHELQK
jgi:hypothetical protein